MNNFLSTVCLFLVVFAVHVKRSYSQYDCGSQEANSGECESINEVINESRSREDESRDKTTESPRASKNLTYWQAIRYLTEKKTTTQNVLTSTTATTTTKTTTDSVPMTIKNVTCGYQAIISEEDDDESQSTLVHYPFSVSIQKKGAHYASGALIDKRWILSVAGEFYNVRETLKLFRARLGSVDCKRGGALVPIKRIEIHPYYIPGKPNFDIALLRMAIPVDYTDVLRPIGISNINGKIVGAKFMTTYWPRIVVRGQALPETAKERIKYNSMRVSTQRLIPTARCTKIMALVNESLNESSLCLNPVVTHHSVCMPDAGAPVIAEDGLWGITSGWIAATCPSYPGPTIFIRLSSPSVRSWLDSHLLNV